MAPRRLDERGSWTSGRSLRKRQPDRGRPPGGLSFDVHLRAWSVARKAVHDPRRLRPRSHHLLLQQGRGSSQDPRRRLQEAHGEDHREILLLGAAQTLGPAASNEGRQEALRGRSGAGPVHRRNDQTTSLSIGTRATRTGCETATSSSRSRTLARDGNTDKMQCSASSGAR